MVGGVAFLVQNTSLQSQSFSIAEVIQFRQILVNTLESRVGWTNTLNAPENAAALSCLESGSACAAGGAGVGFAIFDENNRKIYDGRSATQGFTTGGSLCDGFSVNGGSPSCPLRFEMRWTRSCLPGNCVGALVRVTGDLLLQGGNVTNSLNHDRYAIPAFYLTMPTPAAVPPVCQALTHTNNRRSFSVAWSAGSGNGGAGGCTIQYQRNNSSWANLSSVNCDAAGSAAGTQNLPTDGWPGGAWSTSAIRLVRNSDNLVLCTLGQVRCTSTTGSSVPTPTIDEDCNGHWDNTQSVSCGNSAHMVSSLVAGELYTCPATLTTACGTKNFIHAHFHGNVIYYADSSCANSFLNGTIDARITSPSGPVPGSGFLNSYSTSWVPVGAPQSGDCLSSYHGIAFTTPNVKSVKLGEPTRWWQSSCIYQTSASVTTYF